MAKDTSYQIPLFALGDSPDKDGKREVQEAIGRYIQEKHPMTPEEASWLPEGVRLSRLVPVTECKTCNLAWKDHTCGKQFPGRVCLKDLLVKGDKSQQPCKSRRPDSPARAKGDHASSADVPMSKKEPTFKRSTWRRRFTEDHPGVEILIAMAQGGIERNLALAILEHFGSVGAFERATVQERMKVPRIGRRLAKRFDYYLDLPYP